MTRKYALEFPEYIPVEELMVSFKESSDLGQYFSKKNSINMGLKTGDKVMLVDSFMTLTCTKAVLIKVNLLLV